MWDALVAAAQSPALHWLVLVAAVAVMVWKIATSSDGVLWGDLVADDLEEQV